MVSTWNDEEWDRARKRGAAAARLAASLSLVTGGRVEDLRPVARAVTDDAGSVPRGVTSEVRAALRVLGPDHAAVEEPATTQAVALLLDALGRSARVEGDVLYVAPYGVMTGRAVRGAWSELRVGERPVIDWWWTGVRDDCCDPLLVAHALDRNCRRGAAHRRMAEEAGAVAPRCECGGPLVPIGAGFPAPEAVDLADLGQLVLGGCDPTALGGVTDVCVVCGRGVQLGARSQR